MTITRKDAAATVLTALAVLTFAAATVPWDVWLVGGSYRWAAAVILVLGMATCTLGSAAEDLGKGTQASTLAKVLSAVGTASLVFAVWAVVSGSLTPLVLLTVSTVGLWAASTLRHAWHPTHHPVAG